MGRLSTLLDKYKHLADEGEQTRQKICDVVNSLCTAYVKPQEVMFDERKQEISFATTGVRRTVVIMKKKEIEEKVSQLFKKTITLK